MKRLESITVPTLSASDLKIVELVARHVFGLDTEVFQYQSGRSEVFAHGQDGNWQTQTQLPHWTTSIAEAWKVVEKMGELGWLVVVKWLPPGRPFWLTEDRPIPRRCAVELTWISTDTLEDCRKKIFAHPFAVDDSAPRAICIAALRALDVNTEPNT